MNHDSFTPAPEGCEAVQRQLSEIADSGGPLPAELGAHIASCADCARFADQWFPGPPEALAQPVAALPDERLRERILNAASRPAAARFPASVIARPVWTAWLGRAAAAVALAGFSYWLLNPAVSPVRVTPPETAEPTLAQGLVQMEDQSRHERKVLHAALVDGGREVHDSVAWSVSALEL